MPGPGAKGPSAAATSGLLNKVADTASRLEAESISRRVNPPDATGYDCFSGLSDISPPMDERHAKRNRSRLYAQLSLLAAHFSLVPRDRKPYRSDRQVLWEPSGLRVFEALSTVHSTRPFVSGGRT